MVAGVPRSQSVRASRVAPAARSGIPAAPARVKAGPQCSFPRSLVLLDVTDPRHMPPPNSPQTQDRKGLYGCFFTVVFWQLRLTEEDASELRVLLSCEAVQSAGGSAPTPQKGRCRVAISDRPPGPPWDLRLSEIGTRARTIQYASNTVRISDVRASRHVHTVCLRFVLKLSHVRREPRDVPLRDAS